MNSVAPQTDVSSSKPWLLRLSVAIASGIIYFFSNPTPRSFYDYTFRVAGNLLHGTIAFTEKPPQWLNEFVPFEGFYYSVFPLGAVLSMMPFALLKAMGITDHMPGEFIAALLAGVSCWYLFKIADRYDIDNGKKVLLSFTILFGTWAWTNLVFDAAWQLALGFAMVGELGAIYYTAYDRRPLVAGFFFAMAFGNRTEILLTAPVFLYLMNRSREGMISDLSANMKEWPNEKTGKQKKRKRKGPVAADLKLENSRSRISNFRSQISNSILFCSFPFLLGVATLVYNYVRFHSFTDFGYARIPGVLQEPWYRDGIFSVNYIPRQAWEMLIKPWHVKSTFPYLVPDTFSGSILISSPFLLLLFRTGYRDKILKYLSWAAIVILTFLLWIHGNSGGWQFSYRYAMVLLPWVFVILLENSPKKITPVEWALFIFSIIANAYATWIFHWTKIVSP